MDDEFAEEVKMLADNLSGLTGLRDEKEIIGEKVMPVETPA